MTPSIFGLLIALLSLVLVYLTMRRIFQSPRVSAMVVTALVGVLFMPLVSFADGAASSPAPAAGTDATTYLIGALISALGLDKALGWLKGRAAKVEEKVLFASRRIARDIVIKVRDGVLEAGDVADGWLDEFRTWVVAQTVKLPPALQAKARKAAEDIFQEAHLAADRALDDAKKVAGDALEEFRRKKPDLEAKIASFSKPKAKKAAKS